jgi:hypothetical protein
VSRRRLLLAAPLLAVGLAGCGAGTLEASTVEEGAADALEAQVGLRPEISCPDSLAAEVGATTECTLTAGDDPTEYPVTVTVTSVDGDRAGFDVQVGDAPVG